MCISLIKQNKTKQNRTEQSKTKKQTNKQKKRLYIIKLCSKKILQGINLPFVIAKNNFCCYQSASLKSKVKDIFYI